MTNKNFYRMTMTLNNYHLAIKILKKTFTACRKVLRKYVGFCDIKNRAFEDFLSALDALSNARLTQQIIDPVSPERYLRAIAYDLQKTPPNYELV